MKRFYSTLLFTLAIMSVVWPMDPHTMVQKGNRFYQEGKYENAIRAYEEIIDSGYEAAELFYNLGNAYFKTNRISEAILFYERALLLAPGDSDIAFNLELANRFTIDKIEMLPQPFFIRWHLALVRLLSTDQWAVVSIIVFLTALIFFSLFLYRSAYVFRRFSFWFSMVLFFVALSSFIFARHHGRIITGKQSAIIFEPSVTVKSSPDNSGTNLFILHEGTKVRIEDNLGSWMKIKISDGNVGWIEKSTIEII